MTAESIAKKLKKDISKTKSYENGTIIAWESYSSSKDISFAYAAVYANGFWYTTLRFDNAHLSKMMSNDELMEYLGRNENIRNVRVASEFVPVNGSK